MKKALAVLILSLVLIGPAQSKAAVAPAPSPVVYSLANVGPAFWPFFSAVSFGAFVVYADATGIPFPLCGVNHWSCYQEYPTAKNGNHDPEHE